MVARPLRPRLARPFQRCQEVRLSALSPATKARQERERALQMRRDPLRLLMPPNRVRRVAMIEG
jgi:hypothetical protein